MSSSSDTTLQRSNSSMSSMSSSNEPMRGGSEHTAGSQAPQLRHAAPCTPKKNTLSNRNVTEMKKCHVTGFVNFVEAQPSVGRFKVDDHELPLPMAGSPAAPRIKLTDSLVPTIASECNYGVFHPSAPTTHDNDLHG